MRLPAVLAVRAIEAYQRHISPYKGFCCAYRVHTGHGSCSALGLRAIRLHGVFKGIGILRQRMYLCGVAHRRHAPPVFRPPIAQRGDCDVGGCDLPFHGDCDLPSVRGLTGLCDVASCCDAASCDWPGRNKDARQRRQRQEREARVHLPHRWPSGRPRD